MDKTVVIQNAINSLMTMFANGEFPNKCAMTIIRKQAGDSIPADSWSFANRLLIAAQGVSDARGYKQWQEVKRQVKKGAKSFYIFAPLVKKITEKDNETGEESKKTIVIGFRPIPVFGYDDTEGEELPTFDYKPKVYPPFFDVADKLGIEVNYNPLRANYLGRYALSTNSIEMCSSDAVVYYHELAHAIHGTFVDLKTCDKAKKEIVAEFTAVTLCELSGIQGYEFQGYEYIKHYCKNTTKPETVLKNIMSVLKDVERIVMTVLNVSEDSQIKNCA